MNILFLLADDMGAWAMRCAGNPDIYTPNLDELAARGVRFENFFCASPVCSPARASILTGRMPSAHGVHDWLRGGNLDMDEFPDFRDDPTFVSEHAAIPYLEGMTCYTDILARAGYQMALSGKWHAGDNAHAQHGFTQDKWFTIGRGGCWYMHPDVIENGELKYENRYITDLFVDHAMEYLDGFEKDRPFYLSVHFTSPHSPWENDQHPKDFVDLYRGCKFDSVPDMPYHPFAAPTAPKGHGEERLECLRGYFAAISAMDAGIGKLIAKLKDMGVYDDTAVIFVGDNGMNMGHHGIWGKGNGTFPANMYDTSVKVPAIVAAPGLIPEGVVCGELCSHVDILPTIAELVGQPAPKDEYQAGESLVGLLRDPTGGRGSVVMFDEYGPTRMIRTTTEKLVYRHPYGPNEFYDLTSDPDEHRNLIDCPEKRESIERLTSELYAWFDEHSDPKRDGRGEGVTGFGQLRRQGAASGGKPVWFNAVSDGSNLNNKQCVWREAE